LNPWVMRLLIANVACFGLQMILPPFTDWFRFYAPFAVVRPWTFVTYMFLHGDPMHILFNMLGLYIFGSRVESRMGGSRFLQMYPDRRCRRRARACRAQSRRPGSWAPRPRFYGVLMAYAMFWPRDRIYVMGVFPIEAWLAIVLYGLYDLSSGIGGGGRVAHFAHLGGLAGAYIYIWAMDRFSPAKRFRAKVGSVAPSTEKSLKQNWKNVQLEGVHQLSRDEVNRILDKINAEGIGSLTAEEKLFLSNFVPPDDRKNWTQ
jgi:membrane associated rhomboid family serine protease